MSAVIDFCNIPSNREDEQLGLRETPLRSSVFVGTVVDVNAPPNRFDDGPGIACRDQAVVNDYLNRFVAGHRRSVERVVKILPRAGVKLNWMRHDRFEPMPRCESSPTEWWWRFPLQSPL